MKREQLIDALSDIVVARYRAERKSLLSPAQKRRKWEIFAKTTEAHERRFKAEIVKLFKAQRKEVLARMPQKATPTDADKWLFDKKKWDVKFAEMGQLLLPEAVEEMGTAELTALVDVGFDVTNTRVSEFIKNRAFKFAGDVNDTTYEAVRKQLLAGIADGEGIPKLRKRVENVFDAANRVRSEMIARSEVIRASNFGAEEAYKQSGVCSGKSWLAETDCCPFCAELNGKTMKLGESWFGLGDSMTVEQATMHFDYEEVFYPPLHVRCRCTLVPVLA